ncbi:MAG: hypothetical protein ABR562_08290 [Thermoplasmatota archaeon]|nr:hypothetical protein [Halobacteriales archaeon]
MDNAPLRASGFVSGGLFIGVWLYLAIFRLPTEWDLHINDGLWVFWGFVGLAIAGGLFASRVVNANVRIAVWVTLGIATGMLIGAAVFSRIGESVAALFTAGGGAIIVASLPSMQPDWRPVEEPEQTEPSRAKRST